MSASTLTPREALVLQLLEQAANAGAPCPTNVAIAQTFEGSASDSTYVLRSIEQKGIIRVDRFSKARRVTIVASGKATAPINAKPSQAPEVTGGQLVHRLRLMAQERGTTVHALCAPLTDHPTHFIAQLEHVDSPKRNTVDRVTALLEGRDIPPRPSRGKPAVDLQRGPPIGTVQQAMIRAEHDPFPCPRCGARRDFGCSHSARAISSRISM